MFVMQVLNDANEWELIAQAFSSEAEAIELYNSELSMFADYVITEMQAA